MPLKILIVGLTGAIVSGKTTVAQILKELGAKIIDADEIARHIVCPQQKAWKKIVQHFGVEILKDSQEINRKKLAQIVFSDQEKLKLLNRITHPEIIALIKKQIRQIYSHSTGNVVCIIDAPLLFETHLEFMVDKVIVVYLNREEQLKRLLRRDGLVKGEAVKRIESQISIEEKVRLADYVIDNQLTFQQTRKQVLQVWTELNTILQHQ